MRKAVFSGFAFSAALLLSNLANAQIVVIAEQPETAEGSFIFTTASESGWGGDLANINITEQVVLYRDNTEADTLACLAAANASELAGKIAFLYRGDCEFGRKSLNAQQAGAVAVLMVNNVPGDPVGMGGGAVGAQVTIPVVMVSNTDGAFLRPFVESGELVVFMGNKTGLYGYDLGNQRQHVVRANSSVIPSSFAQSADDFSIALGAWVQNYGFENQSGVTLNITVTVSGDELYNETSDPADITSGDSLLVSMPVFALSNYPLGNYIVTYTISSGNDDEFPNDNVSTVNFWVNDEGLYAKSRINSETGLPVAGGGLRPNDSPEYTWCSFLRSANASAEQIYGVSFSCISNEDLELEGQAVLVEVYQWNDPLDEMTTEPTFNDMVLVGEQFYDYEADLQSQFVSATFDTPIDLLDDTKYLVCATIFVDNMFLRVDNGIDYDLTYNAYPDQVFFPVYSSQWFPGGFGTNNVPAIITHLSEPNLPGVGIADVVRAEAPKAYPNPTTDFINIPLGTSVNGNVMVNVFDISGREVMTTTLPSNGGSALRMDASGMGNGMHIFRLTFEDNTQTAFRVLIRK